MPGKLFPTKNALLLSLFICFVIILFVYFFLTNIALFPEFVFSRKEKLINLWENAQYELLIEQSNEYINKRPLDFDATLLRGYAYFQLFFELPTEQRSETLLDQCIRDLRMSILLRKRQQNKDLFYILGKAYYFKGIDYFTESISYLERAQKLGNNSPDSYEYLTLLYEASFQTEKQIAILREAIALDAKDVYYIKLAEAYIAHGEYDLARETYELIINTSKEQTVVLNAHLHLAEQLLVEDNIDEAEEHLEVALKIDINADRAYVLRGNLYQKLGELERARYEWREALRINDQNIEAARRLEGF